MNSKNNDYAVRVATRTGKMTQEPLYPEGHPKRIEQDSQRNNMNAPSPYNRKKKKNVLKLKMLRIYLLLKKYMVLIYHLLKKYMISITYLLKNLPISRHR